jgi:carbohydrate kinase (thermoresistant glucokinase family)
MILVLMGVSGSGKSTVGALLSARLQLPFYDADHFHPEENILKMKAGIPLSDDDRAPWLQAISSKLQECDGYQGCVLACSALKEKYRKVLQKVVKEKIVWVHLDGNREMILERLKGRSGHFMPAELLQSQFDILEIPSDAHSVSVHHHPELIVEKIIQKIIKKT